MVKIKKKIINKNKKHKKQKHKGIFQLNLSFNIRL